MSEKITVKGVVPLGEHELKFKQVWDLCDEIGVDVPTKVVNQFDGIRPTGDGLPIDVDHEDRNYGGNIQNINIYVRDIPKNVTRLEIKVKQ